MGIIRKWQKKLLVFGVHFLQFYWGGSFFWILPKNPKRGVLFFGGVPTTAWIRVARQHCQHCSTLSSSWVLPTKPNGLGAITADDCLLLGLVCDSALEFGAYGSMYMTTAGGRLFARRSASNTFWQNSCELWICIIIQEILQF